VNIVYDHPFLWGSKRTGPDLHRVGKKYPDAWHAKHMEDPTSTSPGSIMPPYPWLLTRKLDTKTTQKKITLMRKLGVPYPDGYEFKALDDLKAQAQSIADNLKQTGAPVEADREIIALIAYLQRLGTDIKVFFTGVILWALSLSRTHVNHMSQLPLDSQAGEQSHE
jgi:cytochrome c oxidase cbb3-type subunit I/II